MLKFKRLIALILCIMALLSSVCCVYADEPTNENSVMLNNLQTILSQINEGQKDTTIPMTDEQKLLKMVEDMFYLEIPLMWQTDYPDIPYSEGSVATSGCGISCLAMIASYLHDNEYTPGELGLAYNSKATNNAARMEYGATDLGIEFETTYFWDEAMEQLKAGHPVILLVDSRSTFTSGGHFIVATKYTDYGHIMINDPNGWNYQREELINGYENGFPECVVEKGFVKAWIFPTKAPYTMEIVTRVLTNYLINNTNGKTIKIKSTTILDAIKN